MDTHGDAAVLFLLASPTNFSSSLLFLVSWKLMLRLTSFLKYCFVTLFLPVRRPEERMSQAEPGFLLLKTNLYTVLGAAPGRPRGWHSLMSPSGTSTPVLASMALEHTSTAVSSLLELVASVMVRGVRRELSPAVAGEDVLAFPRAPRKCLSSPTGSRSGSDRQEIKKYTREF